MTGGIELLSITDEELAQKIAGGESDCVEFKASLAPKENRVKVREAICAFANDLPNHQHAGIVIIGVHDDGSSAALAVTDQLLQQLADMKNDGNIVPPPALSVEKRRLRGKDLAVVTVMPSNAPPVRYKGTIYIRVGSRHDVATEQDERILNEKRRHGDAPFDVQPVIGASLNDLDLVRFIHEYLPQAFSDKVLANNERSVEQQLAATKMIVAANQPTPTNLGMLVLGKNPQDFLPGAYVQFLRINGYEIPDDIIDNAALNGAIADQLHSLNEKLLAHNYEAVAITSHSVEQRTAMYPLEALQQITYNAIMHRNYENTNSPVRVHWFNDRVEVLSPGGAFGDITAEHFGKEGLTDYRNPALADAMKTLGYVQGFGYGIPLSKKLLRKANHPELEFKVNNSFVRVLIKAAQNNTGRS